MKVKSRELERLAILSEELGEVQQVIGKIIRHGFDSHNPFDEKKITNREYLEMELGDVSFAVTLMSENDDISLIKVNESSDIKRNKIQKYLHYNTV